MNSIPPLSREPSRSSLARSSRSRRLSFESNDDNVFSDNYALDLNLDSSHTLLRDFPPPRQNFFDNPFNDPSDAEHVFDTVPTIEIPQTQPERSSTAKTRLMIDDVPSTSAQGLARALSTSSRLTIPRSQSPYVGPSAPSHPYAMYPQMTRAASTASQSTFRSVPDSSFIAHARPEHPYHMYPQNTVEAEDEDITTNGIPLGFPRSAPFQSSSGGSSSEVGDIIGTDGHIEQLPPYTRYADNTVAKGNMDDLPSRRLSRVSRVSRVSTHVSEAVTNPVPLSDSSSATLLPLPREEFEQDPEDQIAKKEGWRDRATKRTIAGLPVWGVILIVLSVLFSAIVGGVVGGVIGNKQGAARAYADSAHTTTLYLDAVPTTTGPNTSPMPTGHFQIPLNQSEEISQCIPDPQYYPAWGCMDIAYIGVLVFEDTDPNTGNTSMKAVFEDFSVNTQDFRYGPQPPDFNGSEFTLNPMMDKDAGELGVAMFFSVLFDKLSIIPEDAFESQANKRAINGELLARSTATYDGQPLQPSDRPWFCFWNSTMNEFFVYLNQAAPSEPTTTYHKNYIQGTVSTSPKPTSYKSTTSGVLLQELTMTTGPTQTPTPTSLSSAPTTFLAYGPTYSGPTGQPENPKRRSYETSAPNLPDYPKLIKMVEKRKPVDGDNDYVQPYCQKMQVLDDWTIAPIWDVPTIGIDEIQYTTTSTATTSPTGTKRKLLKKSQRDIVADLESYCICEWTSY